MTRENSEFFDWIDEAPDVDTLKYQLEVASHQIMLAQQRFNMLQGIINEVEARRQRKGGEAASPSDSPPPRPRRLRSRARRSPKSRSRRSRSSSAT